MAKVGELTVGIVPKPMALIGYGVFTPRGAMLNNTVFKTIDQANVRSESVKIKNTVKPVYVEKDPEI